MARDEGHRGFTLIEMMIVAALVVVVFVGVMGMWRSTHSSWELWRAELDTQEAARGGMLRMMEELRMATTREDDSLPIPLEGIQMIENPGFSITFQTPSDGSSQNWSYPITFEYDPESRCLIRKQDFNPHDGDYDDPGERLIIATHVSNALFELIDNQVNISLTVEKDNEGSLDAEGSCELNTTLTLSN